MSWLVNEIVCGYIIILTAASTATESFPAANDDEDRSGKDIALRLFGLSLEAIGQTFAYASPLRSHT